MKRPWAEQQARNRASEALYAALWGKPERPPAPAPAKPPAPVPAVLKAPGGSR
jgi:hypothetical protein